MIRDIPTRKVIDHYPSYNNRSNVDASRKNEFKNYDFKPRPEIRDDNMQKDNVIDCSQEKLTFIFD